ncbi:isocitrate lyase [Kyrpidia spormannii]|uniref:Isocitrate lyase n=1 Tax=Kyrpidia spormannii TaxID=2055160 RepID=A0A2K8N7U7_9BACL|nr:isocitrate lyase [Kyrpidia spormannii]ATY85408.1 isocitrate lyase [Kyrpidia spormannii]CAB3394372.1 isocitrate lyase [Kyrpidia spormannii]
MIDKQEAEALERSWETDPRWKGIVRTYSAEDVLRLRGSIRIEHTLARMGAERLWHLLHTEPYVPALGALTGNQAVQQVKAGLKAIYLSGWQVAADANLAGQMYPDQSLYPANSVPHVVKRINQALQRADQIHHMEGKDDIYWFAPIVADAEAGFGGPLNVYELMKAMIEAGAAGVHFEDQLAAEKKCGHMGGKVLIPASQAIRNLTAARLAADVMGVPTILVARTDALAATMITSDIDPRDQGFITGERTSEGFYRVRNGLEAAIARGLAYAPYADMIWCETSEPNLEEARLFAEAIHAKFPGKLLAYNCSPSFNWKRKLDDAAIADFQKKLGQMGYKFQFVTLAGFHALNFSMFDLARQYKERGMAAYAELQQREFAAEVHGYTATKHQREVGAGYFDEVSMVISGGTSSTTALTGSTEEEQFV